VADLIGHERWRAYFERAIRDGRLAHAYLFVGPDGVGKWTLARELARRLACLRPLDGSGCGACGPCARVAAQTHPDVVLLDAVADGDRGLGVEEARERILGALALRPFEAAVRIVAVRDADRIEPQAQNALLKTLEEPPPRSLLVLVARETGALLETVVSRCFVLRFAPLPSEAIAAWLVGRGVDSQAAMRLAHASEGLPGQALRWAEEGVGTLAPLARRLREGSLDALAVSAQVSKTSSELPGRSAFERRRQAALLFCGALAREIREAVSRSPDDALLAAQLERVAEAARDLEASATPELALDRLALGVAPARLDRAARNTEIEG
jgi:DNA polymerase III subunit delta'